MLQTAILEGQTGVENPVTEANVNRLITNLETALNGLVYYKGVTDETTFSQNQLAAEVEEAKILLLQGGLTNESKCLFARIYYLA